MSKSTNSYSYAVFESGRAISTALISSGKRVFTIPAPLIEPVHLTPADRAVIKNISEYAWIIFQDVLAVDYFVEALSDNDVDPFELDLVRVCAVGEIVSDRLRFSSLHSDVITRSAAGEDIVRAITEYGEVSQVKIVIPVEASENPGLVELLCSAGSEACEIPIYRMRTTGETARIKALLTGGAIDEIIFSTAEDFLTLKYLLRPSDLTTVTKGIKISATDQSLIRHLKENGLAASLVTNQH